MLLSYVYLWFAIRSVMYLKSETRVSIIADTMNLV